MSYGLSKSKVIAWRQCPKRLWLQVHRQELAVITDADQQRFDTGHRVGELARSLYPDGILIDAPNLTEAMRQTKAALLEFPERPIFEATFQREGVLCQADVLLPENGGYRMIEVKSSTSVKDYHLEDCAVQAWVVGKSVCLTDVALACIDNQFVYPGGGDYKGLLKSESIQSRLELLLDEVPVWAVRARQTLGGEMPVINIGQQCTTPFPCPFQEHCKEDFAEDDYPLTCLPRLTGSQRVALEAMRVRDIRDISPGFALSETQAWVAEVTRSGVPSLNPAAAKELVPLPYPRYYLDFETLGMAIPQWVGTRPFQAIPVQWSCHIESAQGEVRHREFLATGSDDPRRDFALKLIETMGTDGPVFVYYEAFEKRIIRELMVAEPSLAPALNGIVDRIIDLHPITRHYYYHPEMLGSWSIKAVLPTIAPDLAYENLDISGGDLAQQSWQQIICGNLTEDELGAKRKSLAEYCCQDTWAMVRLAWFLQGAKSEPDV